MPHQDTASRQQQRLRSRMTSRRGRTKEKPAPKRVGIRVREPADFGEALLRRPKQFIPPTFQV